MKASPKVLVYISSYNGIKYIDELIKSVLSQVDVDLTLYIRDDGSKDDTVNYLQGLERKNNKINVIVGENLGYAKSFWELFRLKNEYDYYAFCDQDDYWIEDKIICAIKKIESDSFLGPKLYLSDVIPVDKNLNKIGNCLFNIKDDKNRFESLQRNIAPGCTFVFNSEAFDVLSRYKGFMESHDWTAYIIISLCGKVLFDSEGRILYRLHGNNTIGTESKIHEFVKKIKRLFTVSKCTRSKQALDIYNTYYDILDKEVSKQVMEFANYKKHKFKFVFNRNFKGFKFKIMILLGRV